jgi:arylsulfatase A-like enzyme
MKCRHYAPSSILSEVVPVMRHHHRLVLLAALLASASCVGTSPGPSATAQSAATGQDATASRPNVIVIIVDDMGYGDMGAYGGRIPTPNLDALAAAGARMTSGYVTAAVCAPSRSALLAGRPQTRFGFEFNPVGRDETLGLDKGQTLIAQTMKSAGYRTGMVGKWHVGQAPGYQPLDRGFDSYYGVLAGATTFLRSIGPGDLHVETAEDSKINRQRLPVFDGRTPVDPDGYLTDVFTDRAIDFIGPRSTDPFFLYLSYTAPHAPLQASARYMARAGAGSDFHRVYAAMMIAVDDGIGRIVEHLKMTGRYQDTLIFFVSDNGCASYINGGCSNGPLNAWKGYPWDGGIRVPYLVSWPARIKPAVRGDLVSSLDIAATAAAAAGTKHPNAEGMDLVPLLSKPERASDRMLFWKMGPNHIVRDGRWKLIVVNKAAPPSPDAAKGDDLGRSLRPDGLPAQVSPLGQWTFLYDMVADPGEKVDLSARHPEVVERLRREWTVWDKGNVAPGWTSRRSITVQVNGARAELFN